MERRWNARRSAAPTTSSRQQRQPEHRRAGDVGIRTPPPPSGTAARPSADHSASESVSQRPPEGLPTPRCTPGYPPEIRKVPVNAGSQRRRLGAGPPHRRPPGPAIGGTRVRSSRCCSDPTTAACRRPPVEFAAVAADEHRRAGDLGIRTPPPPSGTAAWPSADHSASESVSQRPPEGLPNPRVYLKGTPRNSVKCPSAPVLSAAGSARSATPAPPGPAIGGTRVRSSGCSSDPTTAARPWATGRVRRSSGR